MLRLNSPHFFVSFALCLLVQPIHTAVAQQTNMALFQEMAVECLGPIPLSNRTFRLKAPEKGAPFIQSSLIQHWQEQEYEVFLPDSSSTETPASLPVLTYTIEKTEVNYARLPKKQVKRNIGLTTHYTFTLADGKVESDDMCIKSTEDTITRDALSIVESEAFPITRGSHPPKSWFQRYIEPVVLTTATVLGVYLFFTLRSESNDDGS